MTVIYAPIRSTQDQMKPGMQDPLFYGDPNQDPSNQGATTLDYINAQIQRVKNRAAPPALSPGSRVQNISSNISSADNFKSFYDQLASIRQISQDQVATAQANAAYNQLRARQAIGSTASPTTRIQAAATGSVPSNPRANFQYAQGIAGNYGWNDAANLGAWYQLGMNESGWNNNAQNPTSTAYGIGQFLDSTWGGYGIGKTSNPQLQVEAMARYIKARYGSPSAALAFWNAHHWY